MVKEEGEDVGESGGRWWGRWVGGSVEWSGKESVGWRGKTGRGKFLPVGPLASVARGEMYPSPKNLMTGAVLTAQFPA